MTAMIGGKTAAGGKTATGGGAAAPAAATAGGAPGQAGWGHQRLPMAAACGFGLKVLV